MTASTDTLPRKWIDPLRKELRGCLSEQREDFSYIHSPSNRHWFFGVCILQALEVVNAVLDEWNVHRLHKQRPLQASCFPGWDPKSNSMWDNVITNDHGVDVKNIADTAYDILKLSNEEICARLPSQFRVLHVENILRRDLTNDFFKDEEYLRRTLNNCYGDLQQYVPPRHRSSFHDPQNGRSDHIAYMTRPQLAFHGTLKRYVPSIVRNGFTKPGQEIGHTKEFLNVRCGSTHGRGIYTSPDVQFALSYTDRRSTLKQDNIPHLRLLACAVIRGRIACNRE